MRRTKFSQVVQVLTVWGVLCSAMLHTPGIFAQEAAIDQDAEQILDSASAFAVAYGKGDSGAIAELFAKDGEMIDVAGNVFQGREAIAAEFAAYFELNPGATMEIDVKELRKVSPGVVIEEGEALIQNADQQSASRSKYTIVHVHEGDKWRMGSCRVLEEVPVSPHERLQALAWMVGSWVDESEDSRIESTTSWSEDGNYLLTKFRLKTRYRGELTGDQRIGWDPLTKRFKSWVHDSQGGYADGLWSLVDGEWVVNVTGVQPDGTVVTSTTTYTPLGPDSFGVRSVDRIVGSEPVPDVVAKVVRKSPSPGK